MIKVYMDLGTHIPEGIRRFKDDFEKSEYLKLKTCVRCDKNIIALATFIANLDPKRLQKPLEPRSDAGKGAVHVLRFKNQILEALGIATYCEYLITVKKIDPGEILILLRSDRNGLFSKTIRDFLVGQDLPVAISTNDSLFNTNSGRIFISLLNLMENETDSLALRSLLTLESNGIGKGTVAKIFEIALRSGSTFFDAAHRIRKNYELIERDGRKIANAVDEIYAKLDKYSERFQSIDDSTEKSFVIELLTEMADDTFLDDEEERKKIVTHINQLIEESETTDFSNISRILSNPINSLEQDLDLEKINIMTMHKAKGLTATAVIIADLRR